LALVDEAEKRTAEMVADLIRNLRGYLTGEVMELRTEAGKLTTEAINMARMDATVRTLRAEIDARGFAMLREHQAEVMRELAEDVLTSAADADLSEMFSSVSRQAISMLIDGSDKEITSAAGRASDDLSSYLRKSVLGTGDRARLLSDIMRKLDITEGQLNTLTASALHSFNRQITVMHGQENGVEEFGYEGPDDSVTREWCEHWVGMRGTPDQVEETIDDWGRDKQPGPAMVWGGGYNCRHRWVIITDSNRERFEQGPS